MQRHEYDTQQLNFGALLVTTEHGEQKSKGCGDENKPTIAHHYCYHHENIEPSEKLSLIHI